tara:strand:- start:2312 stop:2545 length:234 start_codon:yes stop_codon:yes gene_type:complete
MADSNIGSPSFSLGNADFKKLGKGMLIAVAGAALTYGSEWISGTDFGTWTPIVVAGWSVAVNFIRKFVSNNSEADSE